MAGMSLEIGQLGHAAAAAAFLILFAVLAASWQRDGKGGWLFGACLSTALWAACVAAVPLGPAWLSLAAMLLETARAGAWLAFLLTLQAASLARLAEGRRSRLALPLVGLATLTVMALDLYTAHAAASGTGVRLSPSVFGHLGISVIGLLMVENLFRNTQPDHRWNIKYLCFGIGALFAYDLALYSDALLFHRVSPELWDARGFAAALIVPFVAISAARNRDWSVDVFVSRRVVFHSATLVGAGIYLLFMAGVGYYLREFGGAFGPVLVVVFVFAAFLLLAIVLSSGQVRARLKVWINKHFFSYRYDYREEWLRLIETMSSVGGGGPLPIRVVKAIANIADSPDGALWLRQERDRFAPAAIWNCTPDEAPFVPDPEFIRFLHEDDWILDVGEYEADPAAYGHIPVPDAMRQTPRAWLLIPLVHHERLIGCLLLGRPRAPRELNWEDFDLLKTAARQAASYLAEQEAARALAESRQFDAFNRRFAFVLHDIKNLVSQLSLMLSNAEKHRDKPAFQEDMIATVRESVEKMNRMLIRLHKGGREAAAAGAVELAPSLRRIVERAACAGRSVAFECRAEGIAVIAEEERFADVIGHVIQNALDATNDGGEVRVRLTAGGAEALIEVEDDGAGMDPAFVRDELFRPFRSTKQGGYGIGAYESREFVREHGGHFDVASRPGEGTTVRISLPVITYTKADQPQELVAELR